MKRGDMPHRIKYANPLWLGRHPFQVFTLILALCGGVPLIFSNENNPTTAALPHLVVLMWGISLVVGATMGLVGTYWPKLRYDMALTIERIGMIIIIPPAFLYALTVFIYNGPRLGGFLCVALGLCCFVRERDNGRVIRRARLDQAGTPLPLPKKEGEDDA